MHAKWLKLKLGCQVKVICLLFVGLFSFIPTTSLRNALRKSVVGVMCCSSPTAPCWCAIVFFNSFFSLPVVCYLHTLLCLPGGAASGIADVHQDPDPVRLLPRALLPAQEDLEGGREPRGGTVWFLYQRQRPRQRANVAV